MSDAMVQPFNFTQRLAQERDRTLGCPIICPSDRRHTATVGGIRRHAGWGLHNRKLQVRFLSHLPLGPEFMGLLPCGPSPLCVL